MAGCIRLMSHSFEAVVAAEDQLSLILLEYLHLVNNFNSQIKKKTLLPGLLDEFMSFEDLLDLIELFRSFKSSCFLDFSSEDDLVGSSTD